MPTLNFKENMAAFALGRRVNMEEWNTVTKIAEGVIVEDETLPIGFGAPVMPGTGRNTCVPLDDTDGRNVLGITEASQTLPHTEDHYVEYDNVAVCEVGVIGVLLGSNVTEGEIARWDTVNLYWTSGSESSTVVSIPGAQFDEAGSSGEIGALRYRRPVPSLSSAS